MTKSKKSALKLATELLTKISYAAEHERINLNEVVYMNKVSVSLINNKASVATHVADNLSATQHIHTLSKRNGLYKFTDDDGAEKIGYILRDSEDNHAYREVCVAKKGLGYTSYIIHNCCLEKTGYKTWHDDVNKCCCSTDKLNCPIH